MSTTDHPTDVVQLIRDQHEQVRDLLASIVGASRDERKNEFRALVRLLAVHETAEEMVVYPALRQLGAEGARVVEARTAEEDRAKKALAKLESTDVASEEFEQLFLTFRLDVAAHASAEEAEVLPLLMRVDVPHREPMSRAFLLAERMAPTHAHRLAPEGAVANMLVGPFVAMVDKVRDAIRDRTS